ncbi:MAG: hypothetical protein L0Z62_25550 [Gemmataceae bacterium]|nr:hypothetical protein [Gemmataceae bacterium]
MGRDAGRPFPWVVSDFGLIDAIESGLVKVPQLAVRDPTGAATPAYFNIWQWLMVTHIIGLRPFMSQLLCEQVVGRGLRRRSYEVGDDGKLNEEVAQVLGVPFEVIPFKATKAGSGEPAAKRYHVHPLPSKAEYEIRFPRVEGYTQQVRNRVTVDWPSVPALVLEPGRIPPEVEVKALSINNQGRMTLSGPGRLDQVKLDEFRARHRLQGLVFDMARALTIEMCQAGDGVPAHALFPQLVPIIDRYLTDKVLVQAPADIKDVFLSPYYGWLMERLRQAIRPDTSQGEAAEVPRYEKSRGPGSTAEVDYWTSKEVREVRRSHLNYVVADTGKWEQSAAYLIDTHPGVAAFVKNAGLGFAIPYLHNGQDRDYYPDFLIRLACERPSYLILEIKGYDKLEEVKRAAAERWVAAVNAEGSHGHWQYALVKKVADVRAAVDAALSRAKAVC